MALRFVEGVRELVNEFLTGTLILFDKFICRKNEF
jgi:hypothetical protein